MSKPETIKTNYLVIETAMAAYSVLEDTMLAFGETLPDDHPYKNAEQEMVKWCAYYGAAGRRSQAWRLAPLIESVWSIMKEDDRDGMICWDFEFVPEFMLYCLNFTKERTSSRSSRAPRSFAICITPLASDARRSRAPCRRPPVSGTCSSPSAGKRQMNSGSTPI